MKTTKLTLPLLFAVIAVLNFSCQKTTDLANKNVTSSAANDLQANKSLFCSGCSIASLNDEAFAASLNFYYNKKGNPDSVVWDGGSATQVLHYDKLDRLQKVDFESNGTVYAYFKFKYRSFEPLPIAYDYYYPALGGLESIDSFRYDFLGRITDRLGTNIYNPQYNYDEHYTYDLHGNVVKTDVKAHDGGTVYNPDLLEFTASKYDSRLNILGANTWIKFLFFYSSLDATPFYYTLFSNNNAQNYFWYYDFAGDSYAVTTAFTYNPKGFATNSAMDFYDNIGQQDLGVFNRSALSSCDETAHNNVKANPAKQNTPFMKIKSSGSAHLPSTIPIR
jgi:hypothetical protein